jgi:hypothetical protein
MPKNIIDDPIPAAEMACALLAMSGTMTEREAAKAAGLNPDSAAYILSKSRVEAFMEAHHAKLQEKLAAEEAEGRSLRNLSRDRALARLWELANLSPETTRGSIAGQVKAMAMIVAIEGLIPDRRHSQTPKQPPAPLPKPNIYVSEWLREQKEREAQSSDVVASTPDPDQNQDSMENSENGSWVPDACSISGPITDPNDPRQPLWMRMKKRRRP